MNKITPKERMRRQRVVNSSYRHRHMTTLQRLQALNYINGGAVPKGYEVLDKVVR